MSATAFNYPLNMLRDGVVGFVDREPYSQPSVTTNVEISICRGFATIITSRTFRNDEDSAIEAILTFPAPFDAVLTGMKAKIDERELTSIAKGRHDARKTYEDALDRGKTAVMHEEAMRGVHILSIGQLTAGSEVTVITEMAMPLTNMGGTPTLRLPFTVDQIYGTSPLLPADDLITRITKNNTVSLLLSIDQGPALVDGKKIGSGPVTLSLDKALHLICPETEFGLIEGYDAEGRHIELSLAPLPAGERSLKMSILFDRSGSTSEIVDGRKTVWQAMHEGLNATLKTLRRSDRVEIWDFDSECRHLGGANGPEANKLMQLVGDPRGGTELGEALSKVVAGSHGDILVLTDGNSWQTEVHNAAQLGRRITSVMVGENSFEAMIGRLASLTGGQVFAAVGADVAKAIGAAMESLRDQSSAVDGTLEDDMPKVLRTTRSGVSITINWSKEIQASSSDTVGRYAAALAMPLMSEEKATLYAVSHGLCSHLTSLVIVDEEGPSSEGIPLVRKLFLPDMSQKVCYDAALSLSSYRVEDCMVSSQSLSIKPSHSKVKSRKDLFSQIHLVDLAERINWDLDVNALLEGDTSVLNDEDHNIIIQMSQDEAIVKLAKELSQSPIVIVIALLAKNTSGKTAQRLSRRILTGVKDARISKLTEAIEKYLTDLSMRQSILSRLLI